MEEELTLRIILEKPTVGVNFGLQKGNGNNYETVQTQTGKGENLLFEFKIKVKCADNKAPVFLGPFAQGTPVDRFIYIDIGTYAGQVGSEWGRRLKSPLTGITLDMIQRCIGDQSFVIETSVAGTGKDGGPNCATVKPFNGWKLKFADI